jgi:Na+/H+-dicarboxylate symporter
MIAKIKSKLTLPLQLLILITLVLLFGDYVPASVKSNLYAISLTLKEVLLFVMPFIIFSFIFSCIVELENKVVLFVILLLMGVCLSNLISSMISYQVGQVALAHLNIAMDHLPSPVESITPSWNFKLPGWLPNQDAMMSGFVLGILGGWFRAQWIQQSARALRDTANWFLNKCFIPLMPLFVLGLILKMNNDSHLANTLLQYAPSFGVMMLAAVLYLVLLLLIAAKFDRKQALKYFRNILPATITAFSSLSSAVAMPLSIQAADKNTRGHKAVSAVIPSTVGIHLIGDGICVPILCMIVLATFGYPLPTFEQYLPFAFYFVLAKFAIAAVPMGGMLVMIPVFQTYLGFNADMLGLITTFYLLFDPFLTACNTTGNGIFVILFTRLMKKLRIS